MARSTTLITWNVAGRIMRQGEQIDAVASRKPDVVALQEVTPSTAERWRAGLGELGLVHALEAPPTAGRRLGLLVAAREPLQPLDPTAVERPESALAVALPAFDLLNEHVPNARNGWIKPETLAALRKTLETWSRPRVLCGDLNMVDCFRAVNGYESREPNWTWRRWKGGYRLDHVFASADLEPAEARYHHYWRDSGLSDHSALEVALKPQVRGQRTVSVST